MPKLCCSNNTDRDPTQREERHGFEEPVEVLIEAAGRLGVGDVVRHAQSDEKPYKGDDKHYG